MENEIKIHAIDGINDLTGYGEINRDELHHALFNLDYFIIGRYEAEQFLKSTEDGIFGSINLIKEYEQDNFGEVTTDFSEAEHVANMYAYIKGEELLSLCNIWDYPEILTDKHLKKIVKTIQEMETQ